MDHGGFQSQSFGSIHAIRFVVGGRIVGRFVDREIVKGTIVALVKKQSAIG